MQLVEFNGKWGAAQGRFRRQAPPPWWAPGLRLTPAIRAVYNLWLPVDEYLRDLRAVATARLPHPSWCPQRLRNPQQDGGPNRLPSPLSLPDLWALLPAGLAGEATIRSDQLLPLLCALADPPRYGTAPRRYPGQAARLAAFAEHFAGAVCRLADLGCGVGLGTLALAADLANHLDGRVQAVGLTLEPLEAWMASHRRLPHDPLRERQFPSLPDNCRVDFLAAHVEALPWRGRFDLVVVNGLVGGPLFARPAQLAALPAWLSDQLAPGGRVLMANAFHAGQVPAVAAFRQLAVRAGWSVVGPDHDLELGPPPPLPGQLIAQKPLRWD